MFFLNAFPKQPHLLEVRVITPTPAGSSTPFPLLPGSVLIWRMSISMSTSTKGKHRAPQTTERRHGRKSRNQKLTGSIHFSYCPTPQRINQSYGIIHISSPLLRFLLCPFLFWLPFAHRKAIAISFRKSNPKQFT